MFIQFQETPNPNVLKFLVNPSSLADVEAFVGLTIQNPAPSGTPPWLRQILDTEGVEDVFFGRDFLSISKTPSWSWDNLTPTVLAFLSSAETLEKQDGPERERSSAEDPLVREIQEILEERIRPLVAMDGGDIVFRSFEDGIVYVEMRGACAGCPSAKATLQAGVENLLRHYVPEVSEVRAC